MFKGKETKKGWTEESDQPFDVQGFRRWKILHLNLWQQNVVGIILFGY